ncbi:UNVERIFIED_CONTAM: OVARIAN TUMOR DOMAIN-containing deubiquitinating enzyme 4 [Sesamum latifolium]|uniref:OVARIAN TUMOR DOMAIN-containing deubiquitinating enzyme 4 n=1 Tax=Sesamum latifolium TaxID=2727402 RepID=A0AAW2Y8R4_9LAMI
MHQLSLVYSSAPYCTGIPGDGRCLFRSIAHGACIRSGKPAPNEKLQRELADDLRARTREMKMNVTSRKMKFDLNEVPVFGQHIKTPYLTGNSNPDRVWPDLNQPWQVRYTYSSGKVTNHIPSVSHLFCCWSGPAEPDLG